MTPGRIAVALGADAKKALRHAEWTPSPQTVEHRYPTVIDQPHFRIARQT
jgi:hypothetical protein